MALTDRMKREGAAAALSKAAAMLDQAEDSATPPRMRFVLVHEAAMMGARAGWYLGLIQREDPIADALRVATASVASRASTAFTDILDGLFGGETTP